MPGGSSGVLVYEMSAISASGIASTGVPRTDTTPASISRSSGAASIECAAISKIFSRHLHRRVVARAPLASTAVRLPPVPPPNGAAPVSPCDEHDVVDVDAERVGHHLRHRGLEALAVRAEPDRHGDRARRARRAASRPRCSMLERGHAGGLDVEARCRRRAAGPRSRAASCSARNPLVAEDLGGLLERLGRRHRVERHAGGTSCTAARRVREHVAAAELQRVDAHARGRRCRA